MPQGQKISLRCLSRFLHSLLLHNNISSFEDRTIARIIPWHYLWFHSSYVPMHIQYYTPYLVLYSHAWMKSSWGLATQVTDWGKLECPHYQVCISMHWRKHWKDGGGGGRSTLTHAVSCYAPMTALEWALCMNCVCDNAKGLQLLW